MLRLFAVTPQTLLSAPTVPPRSDSMSRAALSDRNSLAPWPMTIRRPSLSLRLLMLQITKPSIEITCNTQLLWVAVDDDMLTKTTTNAWADKTNMITDRILGHRTCVTQQGHKPLLGIKWKLLLAKHKLKIQVITTDAAASRTNVWKAWFAVQRTHLASEDLIVSPILLNNVQSNT